MTLYLSGNWSLQKGVDILVDACLKSGLSLLHVGAIVDFAFLNKTTDSTI